MSPPVRMASESDAEFPCVLTIDVPLPDHRLASTALRALQVDAELSPLVRRSFSLVADSDSAAADDQQQQNVLRTVYRATTNRMLRVSVNGFFESLGVVLQVIQELDVDVLAAQGLAQSQPPEQVQTQA